MSARRYRTTRFTAIAATGLLVLAATTANAACSDRPGTPDRLHTYTYSGATNAIQLGWRNNASEGYAPRLPTDMFPVPYVWSELKSNGRIYFDIFVREGSPGGRPVGQDRIGYGPFESFGPHHWLGTRFTGLAPGTTYCFAMRARTEAGTQGCVSQHQSEWVCGATEALPKPPPPPPAPVSDFARGNVRFSAAAGAAIPTTCKNGYVWRTARPSDLVCVTPGSRTRVRLENRTAGDRVQPGGGAYGPNTCLPGLVWREAFVGDLVCVTPERRAAVRLENQLASSRVL